MTYLFYCNWTDYPIPVIVMRSCTFRDFISFGFLPSFIVYLLVHSTLRRIVYQDFILENGWYFFFSLNSTYYRNSNFYGTSSSNIMFHPLNHSESELLIWTFSYLKRSSIKIHYICFTAESPVSLLINFFYDFA